MASLWIRRRCAACVLFLLLIQRPSIAAIVEDSRTCRCMPWSTCWPDAECWNTFNDSINGRLLAPKPWAWPCHHPNYDQAACNLARQEQGNPFRRAEVVGALQNPNWEAGTASSGCPIGNSTSANSTRFSPCYQGAVPAYAINVSSVSDIQRGILFGQKHNLRLVIKSTGHDYLGRSTAPGSLCIWLHHLTGITVHDSFVPDECVHHHSKRTRFEEVGVPAATAEAGVDWKQLYDAVGARNMVVVGGMGASVGAAGGYVQGGGHSPLSRTFGLSADNVLQFKVVTADGELRIANKCQNEELFWALSGGGGGTYGVVVSATHRTFPALSSIVYTLYVAGSADAASQEDLTRKFIEVSPSMDDAGLAGYFYIFPNYIILSYLLPNGTVSSARDAFAPLVSFVDEHPGLLTSNNSVISYGSFVEWHDGVLCQANPGVCTDATGHLVRLASRFVPRQLIEESPDQLTQKFMEILGRGVSPINGLFVAGGAVSHVDGRNNSVNAAWRNTLWHVSLSATWTETTSLEEQQEIAAHLTSTNQLLRNITPGLGCYMNEADYNEPDWQQSFFGDNYPLLKAIKNSVDPAGLFVCRNCVGSEDWTEDMNCPSSVLETCIACDDVFD